MFTHWFKHLVSNLPFYNKLNKILKFKKLGAKEFKEKKLGVLNFFWNLHTSDVFRPCSLAFWKHCPSDRLFYLSIPPEFHGGTRPSYTSSHEPCMLWSQHPLLRDPSPFLHIQLPVNNVYTPCIIQIVFLSVSEYVMYMCVHTCVGVLGIGSMDMGKQGMR